MFTRSSLSSAVAIAIAFSCQTLQAQEAPAADGIEEIVVSGIRGSLTKALEIKKDSKQIVDSIVAEDIGKFPDNNVVEALQRVTGVQVTGRGGGEVDGVTIRGMGDVSTTVNGRQIFTGTGRDVALADIPASLLSRVDVFKTRSAEQLEGGIAGNIDIKTHRPFNFDGSKVVVAARGIYQSTSEKTDPNVSLLASDRWDTSSGEFGALINLSYAKTNYRDQNIWIGSLDPYAADSFEKISSSAGGFTSGTATGLPTTPGSTLNYQGAPTEYYLLRDAMGFTDFTGTRERPAANISLQWAPNDTSEYLLETFYNGYRNQSFNSLAFINTNGVQHFRNPVLVEGTNVIKTNFVNDAAMFTSGDGSTGKTDSWLYAVGGKWEIGNDLHLKSELTYQTSEYTNTFFAMRTNSNIDRLVIDFNENNTGLPIVAALDNPATANIDESLLTNASAFSMGTLYDNGGEDNGDATTWSFDGTYDADWGIFNKLAFGLRADKRGASTLQRSQSGECNLQVSGCNLSQVSGLANISKSGFFDGEAYVPSQWLAADGNYMLANANAMRGLYYSGAVAGVNTPLASGGSAWNDALFFNIDETSYAAYAQLDYETDIADHKIDGQIGLRFVSQDTVMDFFEDPNKDLVWTPIQTDVTESRLLPSLAIRYYITDELMTRFTYGETIRRPGYGQLNPATTYQQTTTGLDHGTASSGNPYLKPAESKNYDLSLEYYFGESSSIYGVLFRRDVKGFIYSTISEVFYDYNGDGIIGDGKSLNTDGSVQDQDSFLLTSPGNTSNGTLNGLEVGVVYFPDNLPDWLQGAGIQASYTTLEGETYDPVFDANGTITSRVTTPMNGVSKNSYSVVLAYEKEKYSARLSYVWREAYKTGDNYCCAMASGTYSAAEASMDAQFSYNVSDNWVITLDATNLTNELYQGYYTNATLYNNGSSLFARTIALGTRYTF